VVTLTKKGKSPIHLKTHFMKTKQMTLQRHLLLKEAERLVAFSERLKQTRNKTDNLP